MKLFQIFFIFEIKIHENFLGKKISMEIVKLLISQKKGKEKKNRLWLIVY